ASEEALAPAEEADVVRIEPGGRIRFSHPLWKRGELAQVYGERLNLVELLRNPDAAGRDPLAFPPDDPPLALPSSLPTPSPRPARRSLYAPQTPSSSPPPAGPAPRRARPPNR